MSSDSPSAVDYKALFRSAPDYYLVLALDAPDYTIVEASEAYLELMNARRDELVGQPVFDVFPDEFAFAAPLVGADDEQSEAESRQKGLERVRRSLELVRRDEVSHAVGTFRYDVGSEEVGDGRRAARYWSPRNEPVFDDDGELIYILHRVEEVTEFFYRRRFGPAGLEKEKPIADRVLVAIEDERKRRYLRELFATQWEVETVADAQATLAALRRSPPSLLVVDLEFDDGDELALLEELEGGEAYQSVPIIVVAEGADEHTCRRAYQAGAQDVICGYASPRELLARVDSQLSAAALRENLQEKSRRQYRQLFMHAPVSISVLEGPDFTYTLSNPMHQKLLGQDDVVGKTPEEVFQQIEGTQLEQFYDNLKQVYRTGEPFVVDEVHYQGPLPSGEIADLYLTFAYLPISDLDGNIEGVATFGIDVTEQVKTRKQIERESERKDEFLAMLGHELRNPLTPVLHAGQILKTQIDDPEPERLEWISGVIERQLEQLTDIVDDLLDVARISQGRIELKLERYELSDIIDRALENCRPLLHNDERNLEVNLPDAPVSVCVDRSRLTQAIANLLNNAIKYTEEGGHIWLEAEVDGDELTIEVRDDGKGIDPDVLPHIFELFTQADVSLDRADGGLGLGLTLVRRLVEMHGGQVDAHSEGRGKGSQFVIRMPVVEDTGEEAQPMNQTAQHDDESLRVLVVDDNVDIAEALAALLEIQGCRVRMAHGGEAGLELAKRFQPDVIFLDIGLPSMNGYEVAEKLRETDWGRQLTLVALTGYGQASDRQKAAEAGFDRHLVKPARLEQIREILEEVQ